MSFSSILQSEESRFATRANVLASLKSPEAGALSGATIWRNLVALSSLFEYLCEKNTVDSNPVKGAKYPEVDSHEGKTPAWAIGI